MRIIPTIILAFVIICLAVGFVIHPFFYEPLPLVLGTLWLFCVASYFLLGID